KSRHGTSGTVRNRAPTIISSQAEAPTTSLRDIMFLRSLKCTLTVLRSSQLLLDRPLADRKLLGVSEQPHNADQRIACLSIFFQNRSTDDNRLGCLVQCSTCGIGSNNSSLLPAQCFSCCSLRASSLKSRKYQAISLSGLEAVNSPCLSYFPN